MRTPVVPTPLRYLTAVDNCFLDNPGGAARVAWDTATAMRDRGHEVAMVALAPRGQNRHSVESNQGMTILRVVKPELAQFHPGRLAAGIRAVHSARREVLPGQRWDVVHVHTLQVGNGLYATFANAPRRIATVHSPAVLEWQANRAPSSISRLKGLLGKPLLSWLESRLLRAADEIQVLSRFTRARIGELHDVGDKIRVIPHFLTGAAKPAPSRAEARARLGWPEDRRILFTIRHHSHRNGIDLAIRAVAPLTAANRCEYHIAGEGALRPVYRELARSLDPSGRMHFPGRLSEQQLELAYVAADAFLLPSRSLECFGIIILEALARGCPVLASDVAAIPETLAPILPEHLFQAGSVEAMRDRIEAFLDRRLVAPPADVLRGFVRRRYGRGVVLPRLVELLEDPPSRDR